MNDMREMMDSNQERIEAKIEAYIKTIREKMDSNQDMSEACHQEMEEKTDAKQEKMDVRQEARKAQVGSLASWLDGNQEETKAVFDPCLEKMEANPGELLYIAVK
jgi:transcription termination factor NusB